MGGRIRRSTKNSLTRYRAATLAHAISAFALFLFVVGNAIVAHAQVPGELRGRVTVARSGQPIAGARVELVGRGQFAVSHVDGSFVIRGLEPGDVAIVVRALGHAPHDTSVVATNGRVVTLDVALQPIVSRLDPMVVRSRRDSANAVVLDHEAIERSGTRDLGEILQTVPGVVITRSGGPGAPSRISIRGSSANEVLVLLNGSPINSPITGEADLSRIGIEALERISVIAGAQSARYGGRALAGVVALETRRPRGEMTVAAGAGAWGEHSASASIDADRAAATARSAGALSIDYRETRGDFSYPVPAVRGGGTARRVNGDARSVGAVASASIDRDPAAMQLRAEWQTHTRGMPGSIVQPSATGRQEDSRIAGGADVRWTVGRISSSVAVDAVREHATFVDPSPPFGAVYDDAVDANSAVLATTSTAAFTRGTVSLGGEGRMLGVTSTMLADGSPRHQNQFGVWAASRALQPIGNDFELTGDVSGRLDWDSLLSGATLSPRVGAGLSRGAVSLSSYYGSGYAPPSLADQFFHEGVLVRPNPALRPERVRDDLEVRASVRDAVIGPLVIGADAAAFRANVDGMILWQPDFRFIWSPSNFDVSRRGWELSAHAASPSLGMDVSASVNRSDVLYSGSVLTGQVAYRPRTTANATAALTRWNARLEVSTRYVGARRTVVGSAINSLDAYSLSDVGLSRSFTRDAWRLDTAVGIENVFDRAASMLVDYPFPGRTWTVRVRMRRGRDHARSVAGLQ